MSTSLAHFTALILFNEGLDIKDNLDDFPSRHGSPSKTYFMKHPKINKGGRASMHTSPPNMHSWVSCQPAHRPQSRPATLPFEAEAGTPPRATPSSSRPPKSQRDIHRGACARQRSSPKCPASRQCAGLTRKRCSRKPPTASRGASLHHLSFPITPLPSEVFSRDHLALHPLFSPRCAPPWVEAFRPRLPREPCPCAVGRSATCSTRAR